MLKNLSHLSGLSSQKLLMVIDPEMSAPRQTTLSSSPLFFSARPNPFLVGSISAFIVEPAFQKKSLENFGILPSSLASAFSW